MSSPTDEAFTVLEDGTVIAYVVGLDLAQDNFDFYLQEARQSLEQEDLDITVDESEHRVVFTCEGTIEHLPGYISKTDTEKSVAEPAD